MTDQEYIEGIRNSDRLVFASLYEAFRADFLRLFRARHKTRNPEQILDAYQDACVVLWNNIHDGKLTWSSLKENHASLRTYLFCIGRNKLVSSYRKTRKEIKADDLELFSMRKNGNALSDDYHNSQYLLQDEELSEREMIIDQLVADMQEPCNTLLRLHYWEKMSGQQIATMLNYKNPDSVKTQKLKCMKKLRAALITRLKQVCHD